MECVNSSASSLCIATPTKLGLSGHVAMNSGSLVANVACLDLFLRSLSLNYRARRGVLSVYAVCTRLGLGEHLCNPLRLETMKLGEAGCVAVYVL